MDKYPDDYQSQLDEFFSNGGTITKGRTAYGFNPETKHFHLAGHETFLAVEALQEYQGIRPKTENQFVHLQHQSLHDDQTHLRRFLGFRETYEE